MRYSARTVFYFSKLHRRVKIGRNRGLYRVAGLIRTATKRSMRLRPKGTTSRPDHPPHAHVPNGLRVIQFSVFGNSAIVGPMKFPNSRFWDEPVTHIHEFGGTYISSKGIIARYPERSYMGTTLRRLMERGKIPREFSVSIAEAL